MPDIEQAASVAEQLKKLRVPFEKHQISKRPKPTKAQTDEVKANFQKGIRCGICGAWHHPNVVHLDYVGHAALTDRLLDVDITWTWEPLSLDDKGLPALDKDGGLWIKLTICGVTRLGYGAAEGKTGGDAMKERIGDALRNAAMRFGAALELWHKGVLHMDTDDMPEPAAQPEPQAKPTPKAAPKAAQAPRMLTEDEIETVVVAMSESTNLDALKGVFAAAYPKCSPTQQVQLKKAYDEFKANMKEPV